MPDNSLTNNPGTNNPGFDPKPILKGLPNLPGIYRMLNAAGEVIYVGKAKGYQEAGIFLFSEESAQPAHTHDGVAGRAHRNHGDAF